MFLNLTSTPKIARKGPKRRMRSIRVKENRQVKSIKMTMRQGESQSL